MILTLNLSRKLRDNSESPQYLHRRSGFFGFISVLFFLLLASSPQMISQSYNGTQTIAVQPSSELVLNRPLHCLRKHHDVIAYKNAMIKHNKLMGQWNYMRATVSQGCIPKGIQDQSKFKLSFKNTQIHQICQQLYHFAASRTADVIRTHLKTTTESIRQAVHRFDAKLKEQLTSKEYSDVMADVSILVDKETLAQHNLHERKLSRDKTQGSFYVPWQQYGNLKQRRRRKVKAKPKAPRLPSRRVKRRNIRNQNRQAIPVPSEQGNTLSNGPPPVLNLSVSKILSTGHFGVFKKGPKFVPTPPKADFAEFQKDYTLWKNKLRWAYYHEHKPLEANVEQLSTAEPSTDIESTSAILAAEKELIKSNKSVYMAPMNKNYALELFLHKLDIAVKECKEKKGSGDNLSQEERTALNDLRKSKEIIVRPYDKGVGFVVDDIGNYKSRVMSELNDQSTYKKVDDPHSAIDLIHSRITEWAPQHCSDLSPRLSEWFIDKEATFGYFYMNYKAHKPEKQYPGRLITSGCGSPTERLSTWIEFYLKPLMEHIPYRLQDTPHFLRVLERYNEARLGEENPPPIIHCSWDIEAMFPNINNQLGLTACRNVLDNRSTKSPTTECLIDAITITLEENIAQFDNIVVKQINGTAMGPHHSCSYADIAVDFAIDQKVMSDANPWRRCIGLWSRFRDDIYCPWTGTQEELESFDCWLNQLDPQLSFTLETSTESVVFLDLKLCTKGCTVSTSMYSKSSDTHAYLLPTSCHPTHICKNIPQGVMKRVRRNCSEDDTRAAAYGEYKQHLLNREYNVELINQAIEQAEMTSRDVLMGKVNAAASKRDTRKYPLIMKFNHRLPPMSKFISQNLHILELTPESSKMFNKSSLFVSYKMEKNVLSMITKNKFRSRVTEVVEQEDPQDPPKNSNWGCFKCNKSCTMCKNFLVECKTVTSSNTNQVYHIKSSISCDTENVIYMIRDKICDNVFYVGYTADCMKVRWRNHKSHIKMGKKTCEISSHFTRLASSVHKLDKSNQAAYTSQLSEQLEIVLLESVASIPGIDMKTHLLSRETYWQGALKASKLFGGINKRSNR